MSDSKTHMIRNDKSLKSLRAVRDEVQTASGRGSTKLLKGSRKKRKLKNLVASHSLSPQNFYIDSYGKKQMRQPNLDLQVFDGIGG